MTRPAPRHMPFSICDLARICALLCAGGLTAACESEEPTTAHFSVRAEAVPSRGALAEAFVTDQGDEVRLLDLKLSLGPVYVIEERSLYAQAARAPCGALERAWRWLLPSAHAHSSHDFAPTTVVGESLGQQVWSVLSGPAELAPGEGIEGSAGSVDVELRASDRGSPLAGHAAALTFAVTRGDEIAVVHADFDWEGRVEERTITSIPIDLALQDGGTLSLQLDPTHFFQGISFAALFEEPGPREGSEEAPFALSTDGPAPLSTLHAALQRRLLSVGAWQVRFAPP